MIAANALLASTALARGQTALPAGGNVSSGSATIGRPSGGALTITQTSPRAVIDWNSFSIGQGNKVTFQQPGAGAAILNRVDGSAPSTLAGALDANGQVFLVNPNGVAITRSGVVNVGGGFVGSTLGLSNDDFNAGRLNFQGGGASAAVSNAGVVRAAPGGFVGLLGGQVTNSGTVVAPVGAIGLGAGEAATLDLSGDKFLQVVVPTDATKHKGALLDVSGKLVAAGGRIEIKAAAAQKAVRDVVNVSGALSASSAHREGGAIVLDDGGGGVKVSGRLAARSGAGKGGRIAIGGARVSLRGARIDASGARGGGKVAIGGGLRGSDAGVTTAATVSVDAGTTISADALRDGDGGTVSLWGAQSTKYAGAISARGAGAGNGGTAEVSGASLAFLGAVDLRAAHGTTGTLTLDPGTIVICHAGDAGCAGALSVASINADSSTVSTDYLQDSTLATALGSANVSLTASSQITDSSTSVSVSSASGYSLSLTASNLTLRGAYSVGGGLILANSDAASTISGAISGGGGLTYNGTGALTLTGANSYSGTTNVNSGALTLNPSAPASIGGLNVNGGAAGASLVVAGGSTTLNGDLDVAVNASDVNASVQVAGGSLTANRIYVGLASGANGSITQSAGAVTTSTYYDPAFSIGYAAGATGVYTLTGGALNVASGGDFNIGTFGVGTFNQTGGTVNASGWADAGRQAGGSGVFNLSGGAFNVTGPGFLPDELGTGTVNISGAAVMTVTGVDYTVCCVASSSFGTVNLNGGTLITPGFYQQSPGQSYFNFNGGTLQASANNASFMQGLTAVTSQTGGATIDNGGYAITIGQAIGGTGGLTAKGTGTLTLSGPNAYSGATTVSAGTLAAGATNSFSAGSAVTVASGATLDLGGYSNVIGSLSGAVGAVVTNSGAAAATLTAGGDGASTSFAGVIQDGASATALTKTGAGTLTLTGANAYSGATTVDAGALALTNTTASSAFAIQSGAVLQVGNSSFDYNFNAANSSITGAGMLQKVGTDNVIFASSNTTFAWNMSAGGLIDVEGGILTGGTYGHDTWSSDLANLNVAAGAQFNGVEASVIVDKITGAGAILSGWPGYGAFTFGANNGSSTFAGALSDNVGYASGNFTKAGSGTITLTGASGFTGNLAVNGGVLQIGGAGSLGASGNYGGAITIAGGATLEYSSSAAQILSGAISGVGALTKDTASSTLTLSGANSYSGTTTVDAGALIADVNASQTGLGTGPATIASGATLEVNNTNSSGADVIIANSFSGAGALNLNFNDATVAATFMNNITGMTGAITLTKSGAASGDKWAITAPETIAAPVTVSPGTTLILPTTLGGTVAFASGLTVSGAGNSEGYGALRVEGGNTLAGNITLAGAATFGENNLAGGVISGPISTNSSSPVTLTLSPNASMGLTLSGAIYDGASAVSVTSAQGANILSGANSYSGATTVNAGTLTISGAWNVAAGTATTSVAAGATLNGAGVVTAATLSDSGLGAVSLTGANAISTLSTSGGPVGPFTLNDASALTVNALTSTGAVNLTSASTAATALTISGALASTGGAITLTAGSSIYDTANITTQNAAITFDANAANANAGAIALNGATLTSNGGDITLGGGPSASSGYAYGAASYADGVLINGGGVAAGGGNIVINGEGYLAGTVSGYHGVQFTGAAISTTGAGTLAVNGVGGGGPGASSSYGVYLNGATLSTVNGALSVTGIGANLNGGANVGIYDSGAIAGAGATITLTGHATDSLSSGIYFDGGSVNASTGAATLTGTSSGGMGAEFHGASSLSASGAGTVALTGTSASGAGVNFDLAATLATSGTVSLIGKSTGASTTAPGVYLSGGNAISAAGAFTMTGGDATNKGVGIYGTGALTFSTTSVGTLSLSGDSAATYGVQIAGGATLTTTNAGSGAVDITGAGVGANGDVSIAASGAVTFGAGTITGASGKGIALSGATIAGAADIANGGGLVSFAETAASQWSGAISGAGGLTQSGATLTLSGASSYTGPTSVNFGTLTLSGALNIGAGAETTNVASGATLNGAGALTAGSLTLSGSGTVALTGASAVGALSGAGALGAVTLNDTVPLALGNLTTGGGLTISSDADISIGAGVTVQNAGAGNIALSASGGGAISNSGAIWQSAGTITLTTSGAGAIADGAGTINQSGASAITLSATGSGAVAVGLVNYSNAAASTLNVSGPNSVIVGKNLTSTGGALSISVTGGAISLDPVINTGGGNLTFSGPVTLTGDNQFILGAGTLTFSSTVDGAYALTASAGAMNLGGAFGAATPLGALSLTSAASLTLPSISAASIVAQSTGGDVAIASGVTLAASGSGTAVTLAAAGNFLNASGPGAVSAPSGRWLIYSQTPGGDTFGGLDSANTAVWNTAYGAPVAAAGDRYVFVYQPTLTLASVNDAKTYGVDAAAAVAKDWTATGLAPAVAGVYLGDTLALALSGAPSVTSAGAPASASVAGGPYAINVATGSAAAQDGYLLALSSPGTLTVGQAPLTVTANNAAKTYDGLAYSGGNGVSYLGFVNGETASVLGGTLAYGGSSQGAVSAGSYQITPSGLTSNNYAMAYQSGTLTVGQAPLTITANNAAKTYDGLAYSGGNGVSYLGFVNGETASVLGGTLAYGGSSQGAVSAGSYQIAPSGLTSNNYAIAYQPGTLTVGQAPLTITANNAAKTYDGLAYSGGNGVSYLGFVNGETASVLGGTLAYGGSSQGAVNAGSYQIAPSGLTSSNYAIAYQPGTLTVGQAPLTITANNAAKTYDGLAYSGGNGVSYLGFVNGETASVLGGTLAYGGSSQGAVNAGNYQIAPSGLTSRNYAIAYQPGTLTVGQAPLTITANNAAKTYDGLAYSGGNGVSYLGFVNGETASVLGGTLAYGGSSQGAVNAGSYQITPSGLTSNNYAIAYQPGTLTVGQAPLTIGGAVGVDKIYDGATQAIVAGGRLNGILSGDAVNLTLIAANFASPDVGEAIPITAEFGLTGPSAGNYALIQPSGLSANITQRPIIISALPDSRTLFTPNPPLLYEIGGAGLVAQDRITGALTTAATLLSPAGLYSIGLGDLSAGSNYQIDYRPAHLLVLPTPPNTLTHPSWFGDVSSPACPADRNLTQRLRPDTWRKHCFEATNDPVLTGVSFAPGQ